MRVPVCAVRPDRATQGMLQVCRTPSGFLSCLSVSAADSDANGFHSSVSVIFLGCIVQNRNTMSIRGMCMSILQRSMELVTAKWMGI